MWVEICIRMALQRGLQPNNTKATEQHQWWEFFRSITTTRCRNVSKCWINHEKWGFKCHFYSTRYFVIQQKVLVLSPAIFFSSFYCVLLYVHVFWDNVDEDFYDAFYADLFTWIILSKLSFNTLTETNWYSCFSAL